MKKMQTKQATLLGLRTPGQEYWELINSNYSFSEALQILDKIDWDFKDFTTQYLTHKFHSYPARFIPQIPLTFIKLFTKEGETVLDPMCGCGTTLVEAFLNNRNSIGNDFNPLATLISKVKVTLIPDAEFRYLKEKLRKMKRYLDLDYKRIDKRLRSLPNRKISRIFNRVVISKLEVIRETLLEIKEEGGHDDIYDLGRVALSSTIWSLVENGGGLDVDDLFLKKINSMEKELKKMAKIVKNPPKVRIITGDARKLEVESDSVDLIVTSPPYVNALDYYRVHMYNMLWLGMDFDLFKKHEIGAHSHFIYNRFRLLSEYLGDMLRAMIEMNRVLKNGKLCVIVVGNSSLEYELIESHKFFAEMSKFIGFKPIKTYFRNIDKTRKYTSADIGKIDDEYILILQKVADSDETADNDDFIADVVTQQMTKFKKQIEKVQGTSIRGRRPTKERLLKNIDKIEEAIQHIREDIKIKR
ncbi:MAG: site-specific DNA-methyltransferase [Candidatus Methanospirare jalkutatii]|nr:MAG: site-specific DNA-methyltransferase [Candidatus Methanospirare jalkutatii]UYZ40796.1 MAG: site-specific DNA-methyltransferase [Candidatus Methanospirare jalkutatii]